MNPLETIPMRALRRELSIVCKKMIAIAKQPSNVAGVEAYNIDDPEYNRLAKTRDYLCKAIRKEWNRARFGA